MLPLSRVRVGRFGHPALRFIVIAAGALAAFPPDITAQVVDQGVLLVRRGEEVIAREEFQITSRGDRLRIDVTSYYPPRRTRVVLNTSVEFRPDSQPETVVFANANESQRRIIAQFGSRRLTIREQTPQGESVREHPVAARSLVANDSVFALFAILPGTTAGRLRLVHPKNGGHLDGELVDRGLQTPLAATGPPRRHVILRVDGRNIELWFDESGRLHRIHDQTAGIVVEREEG